MAEKIKIGIVGYGNLGKGVEAAVNTSPDMRLINVFTRRKPKQVVIRTAEAEVLPAELLEQTEARFEKPDVLIVCGGSAGDLPWQSPRYAKKYNIVDSFDNHAKIYEHFQNVDAAADLQLLRRAGIRVCSPLTVCWRKPFCRKAKHIPFGAGESARVIRTPFGHSRA